MATNSSDFVLDEGLDDDEDVLAFHSQRQRSGGGAYDVPPPSIPPPSQSAQPTPLTDSVIIDGMPLTASRPDLNAFLSKSGPLLSLQLRRLEALNLLRARIRFETTDAASSVLALDGAEFLPGVAVSVKPASDERWESGCGGVKTTQSRSGTVAATNSNTPALFSSLPATADLSNSFWSAFGAARSAAEKLEQHAKQLGEKLEDRLHVSEKLADTRAAVERVDSELQVSQRVGELAVAGKATAEDIDQTYGISKQVGRMVGEVGAAARTVAQEVDDNLHISEKAREMTNKALQHDGIGPAVRSVVDGLGNSDSVSPDVPRKKKNYRPSGVEQNKEEAEMFEDVAKEGRSDET